jgi:hypothetical protein
VLGAAHVAAVAPVVQAQEVALQHTPRQGEGEHEPLQKNCLSVPMQAPAVEGAQAHEEITQHTPRQGLGVHVPLQ